MPDEKVSVKGERLCVHVAQEIEIHTGTNLKAGGGEVEVGTKVVLEEAGVGEEICLATFKGPVEFGRTLWKANIK